MHIQRQLSARTAVVCLTLGALFGCSAVDDYPDPSSFGGANASGGSAAGGASQNESGGTGTGGSANGGSPNANGGTQNGTGGMQSNNGGSQAGGRSAGGASNGGASAGTNGSDRGGSGFGRGGAGGRGGSSSSGGRASGNGGGGAATGGTGAGGSSAMGGTSGASGDPFAGGSKCTSGTTWRSGNNAQMRPGELCISCHRFSVAGTVYPTGHEPNDCNGVGTSAGATVIVTDARGTMLKLAVNSAGNFYSNTAITMPYTAVVQTSKGSRAMTAPQSNGNCNGCHTPTGTDGAPGRIVIP